MKTTEAHKISTARSHIQAKRRPFFNTEEQGGFLSKCGEARPFFNRGTAQKIGTISKTPDSFISKQIQPNARQRRDARRIRVKMSRAVQLLRNARQHLSHAGQGELLDEMLRVFSQITPAHIGTRDSNNRMLQQGRAIRMSFNFVGQGPMSRPFQYQVRFALSHDANGTEGGYFRPMGTMGGMIVIKIPRAIQARASTESIALLLVHEAVHMLSHLQRVVNNTIGDQSGNMVPSRQAARIIDTSSFTANHQAFVNHFNRVRTFLNDQPHREFSFNKIPREIVNNWTRMVIEESIAYVYQSRVGMAIGITRASSSRRSTIAIGSQGFIPLDFLRSYMTRHWLTEPDDRTAMATPRGQRILNAMSTDMNALHQAVEAQVLP